MIFEKLKVMIAEQLGIDANKVELTSDIIKDLGADSLDIVEMLMNVEKEWDVEINDSDVGDMHTIEDVVKFIEANAK